MNKIIMLVVFGACIFTSLCAETDADCRAKESLIGSGLIVDAPGGAASELRFVEQMCNFDTNKIGSLICELSQTSDVRIATHQLRLLGVYGASSHLPYLYSQLTNAAVASSAMESIVRLEGITSNSVVGLERCMSVDSKDWQLMELCRLAIARFKLQTSSPALSNQFSSCLVSSAMVNRKGCVTIDKTLKKFDPSYEHSVRRLRVLRSVYALGVSEYQLNYVTNAINELVAYPEANLPE